MPITIKIFGKLTELTDSAQIETTPVIDTDALKEMLIQLYPALADTKFFISVNNRMVQANIPITQDAIVALLPPFSGG